MVQRCLISLLLLTLLPSWTPAQTPVVYDTFVTRADRGRSPLMVSSSLDSSGSTSLGVMRVNVTDRKGASAADRNLVIMLYIKHWGNYAEEPIAYRYPVTLAQGQTTVQVEIPHFGAGSQSSWDVGVFEAGVDIEDKRQRTPNQATYQWLHNPPQSGFSVACLVAADANQGMELKNLKLFSSLIDQPAPTTTYSTPGAVPTQAVVSDHLLPVGDASSDWRRYFSYSMWIASARAVAEINQRHPEVARGLRTYVSAGGNLLVYDVNTPSALDEVHQLLGLSNERVAKLPWKTLVHNAAPWWTLSEIELESLNKNAAAQATAGVATLAETNGWGWAYDAALLAETLVASEWGAHRENLSQISEMLGIQETIQNSGSPGLITTWREAVFSQLHTEKILHRPYLRGRVLVASKPLPELPQSLLDTAIHHSNLESGWQLTNRDFDGNWFWRNLITSVGKPPIWTFCAMVTLFGALLGPGLLVFTGRLQRRSLMIFFVPVISLVATLFIIAYGVLHEGFETHVRIASVTSFDTSANVAFAWSRQNYFSGLPPRNGLEFPVETFVRSVSAEESRNRAGSADPRDGVRCIVEVGETQNWRGWLRPRQHQQLLVGHAVDANSMPIAMTRGESGQLRLKNLTSLTLPMVLVRDGGENYFTAEDLKPAEIRDCQPVQKSAAATLAGRVGANVKPQIPIEMEGSSGSLLNFGRNVMYSGNGQTEVTEIINEAFQIALTDKLELEPYGFVTLVPEFEPIIVPVRGKQANNLNLVMGVAPW